MDLGGAKEVVANRVSIRSLKLLTVLDLLVLPNDS